METSNKYTLIHNIRSLGIAYVLLFFFGSHYAYLNKWSAQWLYWLCLLATAVSWIAFALVSGTSVIDDSSICRSCGFLMLSSIGLSLLSIAWWLRAAIDLPRMVENYNRPIEEALHNLDQGINNTPSN